MFEVLDYLLPSTCITGKSHYNLQAKEVSSPSTGVQKQEMWCEQR